MARPREHDTADVRARVWQRFWESGYEATSIADLEAAAGVSRRQLYRDYGDKRGLFLRALDDFVAAASDRFVVELEADDAGLDEIEGVLRRLAGSPSTSFGGLGCLVCLTSVDRSAMEDEEIRSRVRAYFDRIERAYASALGRAVRGSADTVHALARQLFATHVSLLMLDRAGVDGDVLVDVAERAIADVRRST